MTQVLKNRAGSDQQHRFSTQMQVEVKVEVKAMAKVVVK